MTPPLQNPGSAPAIAKSLYVMKLSHCTHCLHYSECLNFRGLRKMGPGSIAYTKCNSKGHSALLPSRQTKDTDGTMPSLGREVQPVSIIAFQDF